MKRFLASMAVLAVLAAPAYAQQNSQVPAAFGGVVSSFGGLQFAIAPGGIGFPSGTMSGYAAGDNLTLACPGVTFTVAPIIGVTAVSGGAVTATTVANPGVTSGAPPSGAITCTQASTSGAGAGYQVSAQFGVIASTISMPSLATGGPSSNGNLFVNLGPNDSSNVAGQENTFIGNKAGLGFTGNAGFNTALGHNACGNGGTPGAFQNNTCLGTDAGRNPLSPFSGIVAIGSGAGRNAANIGSVYIGFSAGGSGGANNAGVVLGNTAVVIGYSAGSSLTTGASNVLIGERAGNSITTGNNNVIIAAQTSTDSCETGNPSNEIAFCAGSSGPAIKVTGAGTPSTSITNIAGTLTVAAAPRGAGGGGLYLCIDSTGATYKKASCP